MGASRGASKKSKDIVLISFTPEQKTQMDASMDYLKSAMVNIDNMNQIRAKLVETMDYRMELMQDPKFDIKESLPFFFVSTDLVRQFSQRFLIEFICILYLFS